MAVAGSGGGGATIILAPCGDVMMTSSHDVIVAPSHNVTTALRPPLPPMAILPSPSLSPAQVAVVATSPPSKHQAATHTPYPASCQVFSGTCYSVG